MSQAFIDSLRSQLPAQAGEIRIQIGRETVYRGQLGQDPVVNKLTDSKIQLLQAVLSASATTAAGEPTKGLKGTVNIDLDSDRVFRFAQGKTEVNTLREPERHWTEYRQAAIQQTIEAERASQEPGEFAPGEREARANSLYLQALDHQMKALVQLEQVEPDGSENRDLGKVVVTAAALMERSGETERAAGFKRDWLDANRRDRLPAQAIEQLDQEPLETGNILLWKSLNSVAKDSRSMAQVVDGRGEDATQLYANAARDQASALQYVDANVYPEFYETTYLESANLYLQAGRQEDYQSGLPLAMKGDCLAVDPNAFHEVNEQWNNWGIHLYALESQSLETSEPIADPTVNISSVDGIDPGLVEQQQDLNELLQILCFDVDDAQYAVSALSDLEHAKCNGDAERMKLAWAELYEVIHDVQQRSPHLLPGSLSSLDASDLADLVVNSVWIDPPVVDVNKFIGLEEEPTVEPVVAAEPVAVAAIVDVPEPSQSREANSLAIAAPSPVAQWLSRAKVQVQQQVQQVKVPAVAIAAWEFHETALKEPARQWLGQRFDKVKESIPALENPTTLKDALKTKGQEVGNTLAEKGMQASREVAKQLNNLPATIREQQIALAVSRLTDTFGKADESGRKIYQAEKYTLVADGKQCTVMDAEGKAVFEFEQTQFKTANVSTNKLNGLQQSEFLQAGKQVKPLMEYGLQEDASQLMSRLGNLAPAGTRQAVFDQRHQQLVAVLNKSLALSQSNQPSQDGMKFEGANYTIASKDGALSLTAKDGRGEIFNLNEQSGSVTSQLTSQDIAQVAQFGQALMKIMQTAQSQSQSKPAKTKNRSAELSVG